MKYAASIEYSQDKDKVEAARPRHRAYLTSLIEKDQLFASFFEAGVFLKWTIKPWKVIFHNPRLAPK